MTHPISRPIVHSLRILGLAYLVQATGALSVIGGLDVIAREWALTETQAAYLISAFGFTFALAAPLLQVLLGHLPRRQQVLLGLSLFGAAAALFAAAPNYEVLLLARALMGLGAGFIGPVLGALGASLVKKEQQGSAIATVLLGLSVAGMVAMPLSALAVHHWGARSLFGGIAALAALCAILIRAHVPDPIHEERANLLTLWSLLTQTMSISVFLVVFFIASAVYATQSFLSPIVRDVFHAGPSVVAWALMVLGAAGVLGNLFVSRMALRFSAEHMLKMGMLLAFSLLLLRVAPPALATLLSALPVFAFATDILWPSQQRRVVEVLPEQRGMALALTASFVFLGIAFGSALAGWVYPVAGYAGTLMSSLVLLGLAAATLAFSRHRPPARLPPDVNPCGAKAASCR